MADTSNQTTPELPLEEDTELAAIRAILAGADVETAREVGRLSKRETSGDPRERGEIRKVRLPRGPSKAHQLPPLSDVDAEDEQSDTVIQRSAEIAACGARAVGGYRPQSGRILRTSLILMLLLQPFLTLGSFLMTFGIAVACRLYSGQERFWGKVISTYRVLARHMPDAARVLKLRAYVVARRWDAFVGQLPEKLAEACSSPDLRGMIRAEEQHLKSVSSRLNRLA